MLLVDDGKAQTCKFHGVFEHGMCTDEYVYGAVHQTGMYLTAASRGGRAGQQCYADAERSGQRAEGFEMLRGEDFGRCHQACLHAIVKCYKHAEKGYEGLSAAHISLQQPVHLLSGTHVGADFLDDALLRPCQFEG